MRARNLKPGFFKNYELADAGPLVQLLFAGLWLLADKEGRLKDQPRLIKAEVFPYYEVDVNGELTVIERLGHIRRYVTHGIPVIEVLNFKKHQSPHHTEKASELPAWDGVSHCITGSPEINREATVNPPLSNGGNPSDSLIPDSLIHRQRPVSKRDGKPKKQASRIAPANFEPDLDFARTEIPDIDAEREAERFKDYEFKNARSDWPRVWRAWIRNAKDRGQYSRKPIHPATDEPQWSRIT